ncbi:hypothetical protein RRG08_037145 [Elysia crispata]|uniref:C-type lectin domain-containing protein n=1 Tax=Elysia crispata TaxID=231223 RepID=A0AAE1DT48_9GAST|nr:hypothetical protein RRG08_037145 [Elysia crispata]
MWLVFILMVSNALTIEIRQAYMRKAPDQLCQALPIGAPWSSANPVECLASCMARCPTSCGSFVLNTVTQTCTPCSTPSGPLEPFKASIPAPGSSSLLYYKTQLIPPCEVSNSFAVYHVCGTSACLHLSTEKVTYSQAVAKCSQMNSRLFIADTAARFSVIWHVGLKFIKEDFWLGLTDLAEEGTFVWDNGDPLSEEQAGWIWGPGTPNYYGNQDCVEAIYVTWPGIFGLNDISCHAKKRYICELLDAYIVP